MLKRPRLLLTGIALLISTSLHASTCTQFIKQMNTDINKKAPRPNPDWITIASLQKNLGPAKKSTLPNGQTQYKWICASNNQVSLTADATADNQLTKIAGQYSDENSAGSFSAELNQPSMMPDASTEPSAPNNTPPAINPVTVTAVQTNDTCQAAIRAINEQRAKSSEEFEKLLESGDMEAASKLPKPEWAKMEWINQRFSKPQKTEEVTYSMLHWNDYVVLVKDGVVNVSLGKAPAGVNSQSTLDELKKTLGAPTKSEDETLYRYTWECSTPNNKLTVLATKQGELISGDYSLNEDNRSTGATFGGNGKSDIDRKFEAILEQQNKIEKDKQNEQTLKDYNAFFKTSLASYEEMQKDNQTRVRAYYEAVRSCKAGSYSYFVGFMMMQAFVTSVVEPQKDQFCLVTSSIKTDKGTMTRKCNYSPKSQPHFTEAEADNLASGRFSFNSNKLTPLQEADKNECES